ncbi:type II toxin-antitoxin system prevent-host-death family antitoxin [Acidobacteria bacterium AB60]|nr:type II toxin-antitoxin system prevent-host-death family antitoxin [Acidobacteria bacterium AB60]
MAYTVHQAKTQFSRLLKEVEAGKEVIVMRGKKPVAKLVPVEQPGKEELPFRLLGAYRGKIAFDDSALAPATDEDLIEMGFDDLAGVPLAPPPAGNVEPK